MQADFRSLSARVFLAAFGVRAIYALGLYATMGDAGLMAPDSVGFYATTQAFVQSLANGTAPLWQWVSGPDLQLMPLFTWLLAANIMLFGKEAALTFVLLQAVIDSGTCVLVCLMAARFHERLAVPAAIAAILNPTQVVIAGLVFSDTLFVFFVALFLYGSLRWLRRPDWHSAILIGLGLGGGALSRVVLSYWVPAFIAFLFVSLLVRRQVNRRHLAQLAVIVLIYAIGVSPVVIRNTLQFGSFSVTAQSETHLLYWIVPLVSEAKDGTTWEVGVKKMQDRVRARYGELEGDAFENAPKLRAVATEALRELGPLAIAKAWLYGAAINLGAPSITYMPPVAQMPRTGFYATRGDSFAGKITNFLLYSDAAWYARLLLIGIAGLTLIRLVQAIGLVSLACSQVFTAGVFLLVFWGGYILAINGPVASPKYRLPLEPPLNILTAAGYCALRARWKRREA
ncbi:glycosyltransferase family 39 protein [Pseudorhodoplanes sp.]|uniref:glycosyltransferase family 39 protein n=1 Tax=Pseudorhodoplanes sp. TaxID=1934341 RepID=UPI002C237C8D|nr:glycosyltransferase family 39 protein [Pseudorhodoplanes sp.]HWV54427.1 glycosyltransferase family 39 protein [Pseudorhodoplanes sp.]